MLMIQVDFMPTVKKIIKASELPQGWSADFTDPDRLVTVTISDVDDTASAYVINLAAPSETDRKTLAAMSLPEQKELYEQAILKASGEPGRKISHDEIKRTARKLTLHG